MLISFYRCITVDNAYIIVLHYVTFCVAENTNQDLFMLTILPFRVYMYISDIGNHYIVYNMYTAQLRIICNYLHIS